MSIAFVQWKQVLTVAIGWVIGWVVGGAIIGAIGNAIAVTFAGLGIELRLRRTQAYVPRKQVLTVAIGWAISRIIAEANSGGAITVVGASAIGGWTTFWQMGQAHRRST